MAVSRNLNQRILVTERIIRDLDAFHCYDRIIGQGKIRHAHAGRNRFRGNITDPVETVLHVILNQKPVTLAAEHLHPVVRAHLGFPTRAADALHIRSGVHRIDLIAIKAENFSGKRTCRDLRSVNALNRVFRFKRDHSPDRSFVFRKRAGRQRENHYQRSQRRQYLFHNRFLRIIIG